MEATEMTTKDLVVSNHLSKIFEMDFKLIGDNLEKFNKRIKTVQEQTSSFEKDFRNVKRIQNILIDSLKEYNANEVIKKVYSKLDKLEEENKELTLRVNEAIISMTSFMKTIKSVENIIDEKIFASEDRLKQKILEEFEQGF